MPSSACVPASTRAARSGYAPVLLGVSTREHSHTWSGSESHQPGASGEGCLHGPISAAGGCRMRCSCTGRGRSLWRLTALHGVLGSTGGSQQCLNFLCRARPHSNQHLPALSGVSGRLVGNIPCDLCTWSLFTILTTRSTSAVITGGYQLVSCPSISNAGLSTKADAGP